MQTKSCGKSIWFAVLLAFMLLLFPAYDRASAKPGAAKDFFITSYGTNQILRYNGATGAFVSVFSTGANPNQPRGLTMGADKNLYVACEGDNRVHRYNGTTGAHLGVFAGDNHLSLAAGLTFGPDGNLYVSSMNNNQVVRYHGATGAFIDVFASGNGLVTPNGVTFGSDGKLYVSSQGTNQILRFNANGTFDKMFASGNGLNNPYGLTFGPDGNLYVSSRDSHQVFRFNGTTGAFLNIFADGSLQTPTGLIFGPDGNLYVSSRDNHRVERYNGTTGAYLGVFFSGGGLTTPKYMVFTTQADLPTATVTVASSLNASTLGQAVTFTASAPCANAGTMTFMDGATVLGTVNVNASGQAILTIASLAVGAHNITAVFNGSETCTTGTSPVLVQTVRAQAQAAQDPAATAPTEVPEADSLLLVSGGLGGLGVWLRFKFARRKKSSR